jgi:2-amino-4-hydroxy-6-hydroxymethyldihydropteridine diphosphokinase
MESEAGVQTEVLDAVIGLGANLGSPEAALRRAVAELGAIGHLTGVSALYGSAPVGGPPQPDFLNAAVRLSYQGSASELLAQALGIERLAGRVRRERWGPRTLDLDILWIRGVSLRMPGLSVPHPRLLERPFALRPLLDVAPDAADPVTGAPYRDVLQALSTAGIEQLRGDWLEAASGQMSRGMDRPCL